MHSLDRQLQAAERRYKPLSARGRVGIAPTLV